MATRVQKVDDRPFWRRRSFIGENISNGNWMAALVLLSSAGGAVYQGWIVVGIALGVAGMLSFVWNASVAKTATIVGIWITAGAASAWLLGMLCNAMFGAPIAGYFAGLVIAIAGVLKTID
ncbi:MAG: hypothetical protein ACKV2Q_36205 [Planctomycetaceae bacterium]